MTVIKNRRLLLAGIAAGIFVCALGMGWLLGGVGPQHTQGYANYSKEHYEDGRGGLYYFVEENQAENIYYYNTRSGALRSLCEQPDCRHHDEQAESITCGIQQKTLDGVFYNGHFYYFSGGEDVQEEENVYPPRRYDAPDFGLYRTRRPDAPREPVFLLEQIKEQFQIGRDYNTLMPQTFCILDGRVYFTINYSYSSLIRTDQDGYKEYDYGLAGYVCSYDLQTGEFQKCFMLPEETLYDILTDGQFLYISTWEDISREIYNGDTLVQPMQYEQERIYRYDPGTGEKQQLFEQPWDDFVYRRDSSLLRFKTVQNGRLYFYCLGSGWYLDLQTGQATKFEGETAVHYAVLEDRIVAPHVYDVTPDVHADLSILDLDGKLLREQKTKYTFTDLWTVNRGKDVMVRFADRDFEDYDVRKQMTTKYRYPSEEMNCVRFMGILSEDRLRGEGTARAALLERDVISGVEQLRDGAQ